MDNMKELKNNQVVLNEKDKLFFNLRMNLKKHILFKEFDSLETLIEVFKNALLPHEQVYNIEAIPADFDNLSDDRIDKVSHGHYRITMEITCDGYVRCYVELDYVVDNQNKVFITEFTVI